MSGLKEGWVGCKGLVERGCWMIDGWVVGF